MLSILKGGLYKVMATCLGAATMVTAILEMGQMPIKVLLPKLVGQKILVRFKLQAMVQHLPLFYG